MAKKRVVYDKLTKKSGRFRKGDLVFIAGYPGGYGKAFRITSVYNDTPRGSVMPAVNNYADLVGVVGTNATAKAVPFSNMEHLTRSNRYRYGV